MGRRRARWGWLIAIGMLAVPARTWAAPTPALLIAPGLGIGPVRLGMSRTELDRVLGAPNDVLELGPDFAIAHWDVPDLEVTLQGATGSVTMVSTRSDRYHTLDGLKVGSPLSMLKQRFPLGVSSLEGGIPRWDVASLGIRFAHHPALEGLTTNETPGNWSADEITVMLAGASASADPWSALPVVATESIEVLPDPGDLPPAP